MNISEWESNATIRYKQVLTGKDITFSDIFVPYWVKYFEQGKFRDVLEIGCGPAVLTSQIAKYVDNLTCVEKDKNMTRIAHNQNKKILNVKIVEDDITKFRTKKLFDVVFSHMVIHNISNLSTVLESIRGLIRNDGEFTFSIPHPCFYHFYKCEELGELDYMKECEYKINFLITKDKRPLPSKITYYHRNIDTYTKTLSKLGFLIKEINEIYPTDEVMKKYPSKWMYPRYIVFKTISKR